MVQTGGLPLPPVALAMHTSSGVVFTGHTYILTYSTIIVLSSQSTAIMEYGIKIMYYVACGTQDGSLVGRIFD